MIIHNKILENLERRKLQSQKEILEWVLHDMGDSIDIKVENDKLIVHLTKGSKTNPANYKYFESKLRILFNENLKKHLETYAKKHSEDIKIVEAIKDIYNILMSDSRYKNMRLVEAIEDILTSKLGMRKADSQQIAKSLIEEYKHLLI